jgi:hypothetical protein
MAPQEERSKSLDLWLVLCWIGGPFLAIAVILALGGDNGRLRYTSDEFYKWVAQVMLPISVLVMSRVFGRKIIMQFNEALERKTVYRLAISISVIFIVFTIGTIFVAAKQCREASNDELCKFHQLQTLSNSGTTILIVLVWPILSMLLDYLFPKGEPAPADPSIPVSDGH